MLAALGFLNESIDASDKTFSPILGIGWIGLPFSRHIAAIKQETRRAILRHIGGTKAGRETTEATLAPQVDLPQSVPRHGIALEEKPIARRRRVNMGNTGAINDDLTGLREARQVARFLGHAWRNRLRLRLPREQEGQQDWPRHSRFHRTRSVPLKQAA